jgi:hypothetical protein
MSGPNSGASPQSCTLQNSLPFSLQLWNIDSAGRRFGDGGSIAPGSTVQFTADANSLVVLTSAYGGGFVTLLNIEPGRYAYSANTSTLTKPNDIGPIPQPSQAIPIPQNSPNIVVACGAAANGNIVIREQYWNLIGDSFTMLPGEMHQVSYTVVTGRQSTSSSETTVGASLGLSGNIGWGPISAGLSVAVNANASFFQQVAISEQSTTFISSTVTNTSEKPMLVLRWQIMDVLSVWHHGVPLATVSNGGMVIAQAYDLTGLPMHENPPHPTAPDKPYIQ